jgi:hypothetical protein
MAKHQGNVFRLRHRKSGEFYKAGKTFPSLDLARAAFRVSNKGNSQYGSTARRAADWEVVEYLFLETTTHNIGRSF